MMQARSSMVSMDSLISLARSLFVVLWAEMVSRTTGPLALRFLLEPLMACTFAIRLSRWMQQARNAEPIGGSGAPPISSDVKCLEQSAERY
ncbi:MAG TPA: hypothetical protein VFI23_12420 [Rhizomicrobium sp.]|nr:hypothetical protein [Rhizomicrobium sp.]